VAQPDDIVVDDENSYVEVRFTPTIPHCMMRDRDFILIFF